MNENQEGAALSRQECLDSHRQLKTNFLDAFQHIQHKASASFAMNHYVNYFPNQKSDLIETIAILNHPWAVELSQKNISSSLDDFLQSTEINLKTNPKKSSHKI